MENMERLRIPLSDITFATKNFDKRFCIGSGGYGIVYKAELEHLDIRKISSSDWDNKNELPKKRSTVAIKRIFNKEGEEGFFMEIKTLTSCNHPNIVSLLGFSRENGEMILVFEFAAKGSLDNCLENNTMANVTWAQRVHICLGIAKGLKYLHANWKGKRRIVHRDIKSANILLDGKWNAMVADFGLSKFHPENHHVSTIYTTHVVGTDVYLDPEYLSAYKYKKESDIYSFGVVLFEMLSGTLAYDSNYYLGDDKGLPTVARRCFKEGKIKELIDPNMMVEVNEHTFTVNKGPNQKSLDAFTKIAYLCLAETQINRPKMEDIIKGLEDALRFQAS
ncbi:putative protein kinase RLK-Pelle-SD-2b family [Helianthus annuus]|nr:putative protein kinase RLK-Pelle-SD-2b family [Helianthus annuus]